MDEPPQIREEPCQRRDPLGRAHQLRVDIAVAVSLLPGWVQRMLFDRNAANARGARVEMVERIAVAIERRFRVTWLGSDDDRPDARASEGHGPLFGGPAVGEAETLPILTEETPLTPSIDMKEHKANR